MMILFIIVFHTFVMSAWHIPPVIFFPTINSISKSVKNSTFTFVFFKAADYANPGGEKSFAGSKWYIFKQIFQKNQPKVIYQ